LTNVAANDGSGGVPAVTLGANRSFVPVLYQTTVDLLFAVVGTAQPK